MYIRIFFSNLFENRPKIIVNIDPRSAKIFRDKSDLVLFEKSVALESRISDLIDSKLFESVDPVFDDSRLFFGELLANADVTAHVLSLPSFLRKFTSGSVVAYVLTKFVFFFCTDWGANPDSFDFRLFPHRPRAAAAPPKFNFLSKLIISLSIIEQTV
jgi:hypothetical protein